MPSRLNAHVTLLRYVPVIQSSRSLRKRTQNCRPVRVWARHHTSFSDAVSLTLIRVLFILCSHHQQAHKMRINQLATPRSVIFIVTAITETCHLQTSAGEQVSHHLIRIRVE